MGAFWEWLRRKGIVRRMAPYKRTDVVRMFPDYAGTVLWYGGGPVDYEDAHLPAGLVADLEAWEASYYDGLDDEMEWRSRDLARAYAAQGAELARRVAEALGSAFVIHGDGGKARSDGPPTSPEAAAAFRCAGRRGGGGVQRTRTDGGRGCTVVLVGLPAGAA